jgi:quinol-cytochrome oxidoreductase complex cytochrome b subunit
MRIIHKLPILNLVYEGFFSYPAPSNITYFWNFGIYALVCLVVQILTGVALAMHYVPEVNLAFTSV